MSDEMRIPHRRFDDIQRQLDEQIERGRLDPEDARWRLLAKTVTAQHATQAWRAHGAPRRRATDRAA
jgi:hypothetical protein